MPEIIADFTIEEQNIDAEFDVSYSEDFDVIFNFNVAPSKVSELENDLHFQTEEEVNIKIEEASTIINNRIDSEVEALNTEINKKVETIEGDPLIRVTREGTNVTLASKSFIFEQGVASDEWIIEHNTGKRPSVTIVDSANTVIIPNEVIYNSDNLMTVRFLAGFSGKAYIN